jgi:hypothetical protein
MATALATVMTTALAFDTIPSFDLDAVAGGFDWGRMADNGNRWGTAAGFTGAGVGALVGIPGGPPGMATTAGIGGAIGGAGGWAAGAGYDAYQQLKGK